MLSLKMALRSIGANKMRAVLTMLGIIIGVMALVVLVSLVTSATSTVTDKVSSLGSSLLTVTISDDKGEPVKLEDLRHWVDEEDSVAAIAPYATASVTGKYALNNGSFTVYGTTPDYYQINGLQLLMGRFLKNTDIDNSSRVCVIDEQTAEDLIGYADCVGEVISLDGQKYTVVGVIETEEMSITSLFLGGTMTAYIPYTSLIRLSTNTGTTINSFYIGAADGYVVADAERDMERLLLERFDEDEDAFSISSVNLIEEAMSSISNVLSILLGGIAAISLIVGGIGIMNIMLVTVTERTREIGIRKALGATYNNILLQFLIESAVIGIIGGFLGVVLGIGASYAISAFAEWKTVISVPIIIIAVVFSVGIGVFSASIRPGRPRCWILLKPCGMNNEGNACVKKIMFYIK